MISNMSGSQNFSNSNQQFTKMLTKFQNKEIDRSQLMNFIEDENLKVETLITSIKEFVHSSSDVSKKYIELIDKSVTIFEKNLEYAKTEKERKEIREDIIKLIDKATLETDKNKNFTLIIIVLVVGLVTGTTTMFLKNGIKNINTEQLLKLFK